MDQPSALDAAAEPFGKTFQHSEALYAAALAEFIETGYEQASINDILAAAGMSKGQFYYHFGSKEALYLSLIDIMIAQKRAFMASVMRPEDMEQDLFGILQTQIRYGVQLSQTHPEISKFAASFLREKGNTIYSMALQRHNFEENEAIGHLIELAYQRGELREDLPLTFIKQIIGYLFTHSADMTDMKAADDFEAHLTHLVEFMKSGLARREANPGACHKE